MRSKSERIAWVALLARPRLQPRVEDLSRVASDDGPTAEPADEPPRSHDEAPPTAERPVLGEDATD